MVSLNRLIVFTRYPVPGQTKTRLIPALGAEGAATLQRQMTEHTLLAVQNLLVDSSISAEIRYTIRTSGCSSEQDQLALMQAWLGTAWHYQPQGDGDLGDRMAQGFASAFTAGAQRIVTIGIDCPELNAARMRQAFQALQTHDLVLGPATDGGYYLIGLSRFIPELFVDVDWGTGAVLPQTVAIAQSLNLSIAYLDLLTDVDHPEDLMVWERAIAAKQSSPRPHPQP